MIARTACVLLLSAAFAAAADPADRAITDALKLIEAARAKVPDDGLDAYKLDRAADALRAAGKARKLDNDLISTFQDNPEKFQGRSLTFLATYAGGRVEPLRTQRGKQKVLFRAFDPRNGAELRFQLAIPKDLDVPAAKDGEEVVVVFTCQQGRKDVGNLATEIRRP